MEISKKDKQFYFRDSPYHAVQVYLPSRYPLRPFKLTPSFKKAFKQAIKRYSRDRILASRSDIPSATLMRYIAKYLGEA